MDSWKAVLGPMCKIYKLWCFLKWRSCGHHTNGSVWGERKEGDFTTSRDPTNGVFEEKTLPPNFQTSFKRSYLCNKDMEISALFQKSKFSKQNRLRASTILSYASIDTHSLIGWFASTFKCTHIGFVPGYCLGQTLRSRMKEETSTPMTPTRDLHQSAACRVVKALAYDAYRYSAAWRWFGPWGIYVRLWSVWPFVVRLFIRYCNGCKLWYSVRVMCNDRLIMGSLR